MLSEVEASQLITPTDFILIQNHINPEHPSGFFVCKTFMISEVLIVIFCNAM